MSKIAPISIRRYDPSTMKDVPVQSLDADPVAKKTFEAAESVVKHFKGTYGRDSWDNKGATVNVVVGYPQNNAYWSSSNSSLYFGTGDGTRFSPLGTAPDVVAHEFMHAVIDSEVKLDYSGEQGGIHESFADVLATGVDGNLQIGEDIYTPGIEGDAIRDISKLTYKHVSMLPTSHDKYYGEPHLWSEPLSHAAYLASKELGLDKVRQVWYTAVNEHLKDHSGYTGARQATLSAAKVLYGDEEVNALTQAWDAVGILDATQKT